MAGLTPTAVNTARTLITWVLRAAALLLLIVGGYLFLKRLLFAVGIGSGGFEQIFRTHMEIGEQMSTYRGLAMLAIGAALACTAKRLARWVITMPEAGCPACGYRGAVNDTCPECGLKGLNPQAARNAAPNDPTPH